MGGRACQKYCDTLLKSFIHPTDVLRYRSFQGIGSEIHFQSCHSLGSYLGGRMSSPTRSKNLQEVQFLIKLIGKKTPMIKILEIGPLFKRQNLSSLLQLLFLKLPLRKSKPQEPVVNRGF